MTGRLEHKSRATRTSRLNLWLSVNLVLKFQPNTKVQTATTALSVSSVVLLLQVIFHLVW